MIRSATFLVSALALLATGASVSAKPRLTPEQALAKALEGRVAGEAKRCIAYSQIQSSRVIDGAAILYEVGNTLYVNRPEGAESLDDSSIPIVRVHGSSLCDTDVIELVDRSTHMFRGSVFLNEFVPYKKVKAKG